MDIYIAMEESYKNGYIKGVEDTKKLMAEAERHGRWIIHSSGKGDFANNWAECSYCRTCGSPRWKRCPVCEAKMEVELADPCPDAKTIKIEKIGNEVKTYGNESG